MKTLITALALIGVLASSQQVQAKETKAHGYAMCYGSEEQAREVYREDHIYHRGTKIRTCYHVHRHDSTQVAQAVKHKKDVVKEVLKEVNKKDTFKEIAQQPDFNYNQSNYQLLKNYLLLDCGPWDVPCHLSYYLK